MYQSLIDVYMRIMQPFRMAGMTTGDPRFTVQVVGHRQSFPEAVDAAKSPDWFCFLFHHPAIVLGADGEQVLPAGGVLIVGPGDRIHHRPAGSRLERSWLRCSGTMVAGALAEAGLTRRSALNLCSLDAAVEALLGLHRICVHPRPPTISHLLAHLQALLQVIVRDAAPRPAVQGISEVRRHLEASYMLPLRLDALAGMAGCSRAQFCRRFRAALGCSPGQYVQRLRLDAARELLLTTDRSIPEIATTCGFADRFHFSRIFSRSSGLGPATCRQRGGVP
jgi:AraC-like DNA-binding protein